MKGYGNHLSFLYNAPPDTEGHVEIAGPHNSPLRKLSFGRLTLVGHDQHYGAASGEWEVVLHLLVGSAVVLVNGTGYPPATFVLPDRPSPFAGGPSIVYIPRDSTYLVESTAACLSMAVISAPARQCNAPFATLAGDDPGSDFGSDNWQRRVYLPLPAEKLADRLIVGETHTPSGNWSSYPPHKHDVDAPPHEIPAEEIYAFYIDPPHGFGYQRLYTAPEDPKPFSELYLVQNGDTVVIPRGYHPVVVAPGYRMVTVWALSLDSRVFGAWQRDPQHSQLAHER
jgi:5-deoxy-glucuronate isomerase